MVLPPNSLRRRFFSGALWSVLGAGLSQGLGFAAYVAAARLLGQRAFGEFGMIQSTVGMFGVFAGIGLGLTATKHVAEFRSIDPARAGRVIGMSLVAAVLSGGLVAAILAIAAPSLAAATLRAPGLVRELRLGCLLLFFNAIAGVQTGALSGFEAFRRVAWTNALRGVLNFAFLTTGACFGGLQGVVLGSVATACAGILISQVVLVREVRACKSSIICCVSCKELQILWRFSLPAFLCGSMVAPASWWARALLVNQPGGYAEMGIFTAASRFQDVLTLAGETLGVALLPMLASKEASHSERFQRMNLLLSWVLGIGPAAILISFPEIGSLLFGRDYAGREMNSTVVLVLCFTCIVMYKQGLARILAANDLMWLGFASNVVWAIVLLTGAHLLAGYGASGVALAYLIAYGVNTACFLPFYARCGLAPRSLIFSKEALMIWAAIGALAGLTLTGAALTVRAVTLLIAASLLFVNLHRLAVPRRGIS